MGMKATFQPALDIKAHAQTSPEATFSAIAFAIISAQTRLNLNVNTNILVNKWVKESGKVKAYADVTQEEKSMCGTGLSPRKVESLTYIWENRKEIHAKYLECLNMEKGHLTWWNYCMDVLSGMGLVKAAFCTQLMFNELGCIDTHNAKELGIDMPKGKSNKGRAIYLEIQSVKDSKSWWCDWCDFLAEKYPHIYKDGNEVSELHFKGIFIG